MPTSSAPSRVPPNHAETNPSRVSTIVDACALANGAVSKMNSDATIAAGSSARPAPVAHATPSSSAAALTLRDNVELHLHFVLHLHGAAGDADRLDAEIALLDRD